MSLLKTILILLLTLKLGKMHHKEFKRNHQHPIIDMLDKFKMKRKEAFVVTPPFEMNIVMPKSLNDDNINRQVTNVHDKSVFDDDVVRSIIGNADIYENIDQKDSDKFDNEYDAHLRINDIIDVLNKQNELVQKLAALYQSKTNNKQNYKPETEKANKGKQNENVKKSCNEKVCKQSLRAENGSDECVVELTCFSNE